jgi:hypothetical protein
MNNIAFQHELRPELPNVYGSTDYLKFREILFKIDQILKNSQLEHDLVTQVLDQYVATKQIDPKEFYNGKKASFHYRKLRHALRCNIARHLTGESYRVFSVRLADSMLFQWFTGIDMLSSRKAISKSTLERYEKCFDEEKVSNTVREWLSGLSEPNKSSEIGLKEPIDTSEVFMDGTCIKANIHFPTDWVLMRDATRSLMLATQKIREQGLKHRMTEPSVFLKQMNKLCITMTHVRRKADSKKQRKKIFRAMKKLSQCIAKHGYRYRDLLNKKWEETSWTEAQAKQVIRRLDNILNQLPCAIKQAHERIVGERKILSKNKILSLYDRDVHVIVRGKAESEVEFGQGFLLTEQKNGLIVDWQLFTGQPPSDTKLIKPTLARLKKHYGNIHSVCADRGFDSKGNNVLLEQDNIMNAICPKSPKQLQERLSDPIFVALQTRRSQTEARIGIFKNVFLGRPLRSRITTNKRSAITWCVLTHNLWVLARMSIIDEHAVFRRAA